MALTIIEETTFFVAGIPPAGSNTVAYGPKLPRGKVCTTNDAVVELVITDPDTLVTWNVAGV